MKKVNILWTGGFDSTFRMIELSRQEVLVVPIYVMDESRKSTQTEIDAMEKMREMLLKHSETIAEIRPIVCYSKKDIEIDPAISSAFRKIRQLVAVGTQYEWLACLAKKLGRLEIGVEKPNDDYSGCNEAINKTGGLVECDGTYLVSESSNEECKLLFGNFSFPIIGKTELEMKAELDSLGTYADIMNSIWFCHVPYNQEPCGVCRPCQQKMECGMASLLPVSAQKRYSYYKGLRSLMGSRCANYLVSKVRTLLGK